MNKMYSKESRSTFIYGTPLVLLILLMSTQAVPQLDEPQSAQLPVNPTTNSQVVPNQASVQPRTNPAESNQINQLPEAQLQHPQRQDPLAQSSSPAPTQRQSLPADQEAPRQQQNQDDSNDQHANNQLPPLTTSSTTTITTTTTTTTDNPYRLPTVIPENDFNKDILDYGDTFLADLQFAIPKTSPMNNLTKYTRDLINKHHDNDQLYAYLLQLAQMYPRITRLYSIGQSVEGRKLWVLEISESPGKHEPMKPEFRYIANMHGNEVVGRELLLHLARLILDNYYADDGDQLPENKGKPSGHKFIKKLVRATRIHLMPSMNPDGYERSDVGCKWESPSRKGRLNANNIDLNRNFPNSVIGTKLDAGTQPETQAIMEWSKREPFALSANLHGGAVVAIIPWDSSLNTSTIGLPDERKCPDHDTFMDLARAYSKSHWTMSDGKMCYDKCTDYHPEVFPNDGVTTGSGWYQFYGSMMDWVYTNTNDFQITLELGCNMYPPAEALIQYWDMNKVALLNFMRQIHRGIKGTVVDAQNGVPLAHVNVHVRSIDHNVTSTAAGDYFRLLAPGQYNVLYERAGYDTEEIFVRIGETMAQVHHIRLKPNGQMGPSTNTPSSPTGGEPADEQQIADEPRRGPDDGEAHPVAVATLVMSVITVLLLVFLAGAYVIQKRRFARSQSVSVEMQPSGRSNSGTGISLPPIKSTVSSGVIGGGGSLSTHTHA